MGREAEVERKSVCEWQKKREREREMFFLKLQTERGPTPAWQ